MHHAHETRVLPPSALAYHIRLKRFPAESYLIRPTCTSGLLPFLPFLPLGLEHQPLGSSTCWCNNIRTS
jgi:hypothetical protein